MFKDEDALRVHERMEAHLACPNVSLSDYRQTKRLSLSAEVLPLTRIYLDTKYWLKFRDVSLGRDNCPVLKELLGKIRNGCGQRKLICPVSYAALIELFRQEDRDTRNATAELMDELSGGVCLLVPHHLLGVELDCLLRATIFDDRKWYTPKELVWTKVGYWVGECTLTESFLPQDVSTAIQKAMDDVICELKVVDLANNRPPSCNSTRTEYEYVADLLTKMKKEMPHAPNNFKSVFLTELDGLLDVNHEVLEEVMAGVCHEMGHEGEISREDKTEGGAFVKKLIWNAYRLKKLSNHLPQLHIGASLHAIVRMDAKRKYNANDFEDFRHAGSALPYCDIFLTEKYLRHLLCSNPLNMDSLYKTSIAVNAAEALNIIGDI